MSADGFRLNPSVSKLQAQIFLEKNTEEILEYEGETIVDKIDKLILTQETSIEGEAQSAEDNLFSNLYKLEIERIKYMLKTYLRVRLAKVSAGNLIL
jgi:GINS complex subunit 4